MADNYANARDVLPRELLVLVQQYHSGGLLWVPDRKRFYRERDAVIRRLHEEGVPVAVIARQMHLCEKRIRQIVRREGKNS